MIEKTYVLLKNIETYSLKDVLNTDTIFEHQPNPKDNVYCNLEKRWIWEQSKSINSVTVGKTVRIIIKNGNSKWHCLED